MTDFKLISEFFSDYSLFWTVVILFLCLVYFKKYDNLPLKAYTNSTFVQGIIAVITTVESIKLIRSLLEYCNKVIETKAQPIIDKISIFFTWNRGMAILVGIIVALACICFLIAFISMKQGKEQDQEKEKDQEQEQPNEFIDLLHTLPKKQLDIIIELIESKDNRILKEPNIHIESLKNKNLIYCDYADPGLDLEKTIEDKFDRFQTKKVYKLTNYAIQLLDENRIIV